MVFKYPKGRKEDEMRVWISRDSKRAMSDIEIWDSEPARDGGGYISKDMNNKRIAGIYAPHFKILFGFTPRKGSCRECEINLRVLRVLRRNG